MLSSMTSLHLIFPYVAAKHIYKHTSGRNFAQNAGKMENVDQSGEGVGSVAAHQRMAFQSQNCACNARRRNHLTVRNISGERKTE